jgi:hypothetical protein
VCIAVYVIIIITSLLAKVKLNEGQGIYVNSDITGGKLVEMILKDPDKQEFSLDLDNIEKTSEQDVMLPHNTNKNGSSDVDYEEETIDFNKCSENDEDDETILDDEDIENNEEDGQKHFNYNTTKRSFQFESNNEIEEIAELIQKEKDEESKEQELQERKYFAVSRVKGVLTYGTDKKKQLVELSDDIHDSNSVTAIAIAGYVGYKLIIDEQKPLRYKLIDFFLLIPKIISQVGWIVPLVYIFGEFSIDAKLFVIAMTTIIISTLLTTLSVFYSKYIADITIDGLVESDIVSKEEKYNLSKTISIIPLRELSDNFKFLRWCLKKLGYAI